MTRLGRKWVLLGALAALLAVGLGVGAGVLFSHHPSAPGRVLVLVTVDRPLPAGGAALQGQVLGLSLTPTGQSSAVAVPVAATPVTLSRRWLAPTTESLFLASVASGPYQQARLTLRTAAGRLLHDSQRLVLQVTAGHLTPLLFTFKLQPSTPSAQLLATTAYAGNDQVNFGLKVAAGTVMSVPQVPLLDQAGHPLALSSYRGKIVVLASFLTECQETCPLVTSALLQLQRLLQRQNLQHQVQILEVTQDPADDTPAVLTKYQRYFSLPWPLLTGTPANINRFWTGLKVPPIQEQPWGGPSPLDRFTGRPEPYNLVHASVVEVINSQGYVVEELENQPTLSTGSIPSVIYQYLDQQGREQQRAGGSWTPASLLDSLTPLLHQNGVYTSLPATTSNGAAKVGDPAPLFSLPSSAGGSVELTQELGHPVLLDFWATWCQNCRADMRLVAATAQRYESQGLRVLLIDYQESGSTAADFLKRLGVHLPTLLDRNAAVSDRYGVPGLPVAVFVNPQGVISAIQLGQLQQAQVAQDLPAILGS